jgi:hypothetical protein
MGPDFETRTDASGRYVFPALRYGTYNMEVQAEGFLSSPDPSTNLKVRLTIDSAEPVRRDISLAVVAAIVGRILDDKREPVPGLGVEVLQLIPDSFGRPQWHTVASARTDTGGEYRVDGLSTNDYYVRASARNKRSSADMAATYFPGTADPRSAAVVSLREGETSASFSLANERTYSVEGRITQQDSKPAISSLLLYAFPQDSSVPIERSITSGASVEASAEGIWDFELRGLLPGVYDIFAVAVPVRTFSTAVDPLAAELREMAFGAEVPGRVATTTVEIRDENVRDLRLSLEPGVNVVGRLRLVDDGGKPLTLENKGGVFPIEIASDTATAQVFLGLNRRELLISGLVNVRPVLKEGESLFTFPGVSPGTYDIALRENRADSDFYLADVRVSARSIFDEGLAVRSEPIEFLEVVVGFDGGVVEGGGSGNGESRVLVVLAPHPSRRQNGALFKTAELSDSTLPFRFTGVAPGLYSIFAFELPDSLETVPYRNRDFLSLHETESRSVTVGKAATVGGVQVPMIPR